jgi:glyoxylase-like metal-dependent hydrolase (beta-lactamase superfamily II)
MTVMPMDEKPSKLNKKGVASPGWHRFSIGDFEVTVISDGPLPMTPPSSGYSEAPASEIEQLLGDHFLPIDKLLLGQNAVLVNNGRQLALIDTGMGDSMGPISHMFGPSTGHLVNNLRASGVEPEHIDVIMLSHGHPDHCWGLVDANGEAVFKNAELAVNENELNHWLDESSASVSEFAKVTVSGARKNFSPYLDRLILTKDGRAVISGVSTFACPGHSVAHQGFIIESDGQMLVNIADLAHHHVLALRNPAWEMSTDTDPKEAARSRLRMLDMLATDRAPVLGYHFPWPGAGHIVRAGSGYAWAADALYTHMMKS